MQSETASDESNKKHRWNPTRYRQQAAQAPVNLSRTILFLLMPAALINSLMVLGKVGFTQLR